MICTIVAASERVPIVIQPSHHRKKYCLPEFIFPGMSIVLFWGVSITLRGNLVSFVGRK